MGSSGSSAAPVRICPEGAEQAAPRSAPRQRARGIFKQLIKRAHQRAPSIQGLSIIHGVWPRCFSRCFTCPVSASKTATSEFAVAANSSGAGSCETCTASTRQASSRARASAPDACACPCRTPRSRCRRPCGCLHRPRAWARTAGASRGGLRRPVGPRAPVTLFCMPSRATRWARTRASRPRSRPRALRPRNDRNAKPCRWGCPGRTPGRCRRSKNGSDIARELSCPSASRVTVSRRPLSHIDETRLGPEGITSTQPAVSISPSTFSVCGSSTPKEAAGVM